MKNKSNSNKSRRSFIKNTSIATGAIVASPLFVEAMSNVHAEKKLKIALVGCGGRGSGAAIQALKADENVELVAMADVFKDRLESSLKNINEYFEGARRIKIKEKNRFVGFDAYKKAIDLRCIILYPSRFDISF